MLTTASLSEFALIEYRRDSKFKKMVDERVGGLQKVNAIPLGTPLEEVFSLHGEDGLPLSKVWLNEFHGRANLPQWLRARALARAG